MPNGSGNPRERGYNDPDPATLPSAPFRLIFELENTVALDHPRGHESDIRALRTAPRERTPCGSRLGCRFTCAASSGRAQADSSANRPPATTLFVNRRKLSMACASPWLTVVARFAFI